VTPTLRGIRCGYDKFVWDHRLLWIEIPLTVAFGHNSPPILRATGRRLKCKVPRIVAKYLTEYVTWIEHFDLLGTAKRLQEQVGRISEARMKTEYDRLDKIWNEAMMFANKHCRKLKMGAKQWTPNYQAARDKVTLWKLIVQKIQGKSVHTRFLKRLMTKCDKNGAIHSTLLLSNLCLYCYA
jgi:hypothetical protein